MTVSMSWRVTARFLLVMVIALALALAALVWLLWPRGGQAVVAQKAQPEREDFKLVKTS